MSSHAAPAAEMLAPPPPIDHALEPQAAAPRRGSGALDWIAPVRAWQTVAWEAAALAAVAGTGRSTATQAAAYAGAGALVGVTSLRIHGRCLAQWADTQGRYRYRRVSARRRGAQDGAVADPLAALLPDLGLGEYVDRAGNRVGLAATDGGWVSAVRLGPTAETNIGTLIDVLRHTYAGTTIPLACAQLVVWTAAPPEIPPFAPQQAQQSQQAQSSQAPDLDMTMTLPAWGHSGQHGQPTRPIPNPAANPALNSAPDPAARPRTSRAPMRVTWLALRYRPRLAPHAAAARGGGELGAARAAASAALGLVAQLDAAGYPANALDQSELGQELMVAVHGANPAPPAVEETWSDWTAGALRQACYEPRRGVDPAELLDQWVPDAAFT